MITGLVTDGLLGQGLASGGLLPPGVPVLTFTCSVDPRAVQGDLEASVSVFGDVDPLAVQNEDVADYFGSVDPLAVQDA